MISIHRRGIELDRSVAENSANPDAKSIATYPVFGSRFVSFANEIYQNNITQIDPSLRTRILLFDWWIDNSDRSMTDGLGNPNLLWVAHEKKLYVIDHNLAFDPACRPTFWSEHIFRADKCLWTPAFQSGIMQEMEAALNCLPQYWKAMPEEWVEFDSDITFDFVHNSLSRFKVEKFIFWNKP